MASPEDPLATQHTKLLSYARELLHSRDPDPETEGTQKSIILSHCDQRGEMQDPKERSKPGDQPRTYGAGAGAGAAPGVAQRVTTLREMPEDGGALVEQVITRPAPPTRGKSQQDAEEDSNSDEETRAIMESVSKQLKGCRSGREVTVEKLLEELGKSVETTRATLDVGMRSGAAPSKAGKAKDRTDEEGLPEVSSESEEEDEDNEAPLEESESDDGQLQNLLATLSARVGKPKGK